MAEKSFEAATRRANLVKVGKPFAVSLLVPFVPFCGYNKLLLRTLRRAFLTARRLFMP